jgi:hypothetical protein
VNTNDDLPVDRCNCGQLVTEGAHCRLCHDSLDTFEEILNHLRLMHPQQWEEDIEPSLNEVRDAAQKLRKVQKLHSLDEVARALGIDPEELED